MRSRKSYKKHQKRQKYLRNRRLKEKLEAKEKLDRELRKDRNKAIAVVFCLILALVVFAIISMYVIEKYIEQIVIVLGGVIVLVVCALLLAGLYGFGYVIWTFINSAIDNYKAYKARKLQELLCNIAEVHC